MGSRDISSAARAAYDATQRHLIALAACRVIDQDGLQKASFRRIAEELECSAGLIQHYFANKEDLLVAALRAAARQLRGDLEKHHPESPDLKVLRDAFIDSLTSRVSDSLYWRVVIAYRGAALSSERLRHELREHDPEDREFIRLCLSTELSLAVDDPHIDLLADCLYASLEGISTAAVLDPESYTPERLAPMIDALISGVLGSKPSPQRQRRSR